VSVRVWRLDRSAVLSRLGTWARSLGDDPAVVAVVLFGSWARGEATPASDADVLILLQDSPADFDDRMVRHKPRGLGVSVEVFPYTLAEAQRALEESWGVVGIALKEGRVLFERGGALESLMGNLNAAPE
jgi:predicted nucleotidyltransferase